MKNVSQQHTFRICLLSDLQELPCFLLPFDWSFRRGEKWVQAPASWTIPLPQRSNSLNSLHIESVFPNKAILVSISVHDALDCLLGKSEMTQRANGDFCLSLSVFYPDKTL